MPPPREAWQEESKEPGTQYMSTDYNTNAAHSGMTEDPVPLYGIEAISETPIPSTGGRTLQIVHGHQVIHFNILKILTEFNLN